MERGPAAPRPENEPRVGLLASEAAPPSAATSPTSSSLSLLLLSLPKSRSAHPRRCAVGVGGTGDHLPDAEKTLQIYDPRSGSWDAQAIRVEDSKEMLDKGVSTFKSLDLNGQLYLAGVYFVTYAGRVAEDLAYWPGLAILLAAIGLRIAAFVQSDRLRSRMLPTE